MSEVRNEAEDYLRAYRAEYEAYRAAGLEERAAAVAAVLRNLGDNIEPVAPRETVVDHSPVERAVEEPAVRRRGRPPKEAANG